MSISACGTLLHLGPELTAELSDLYHDTLPQRKQI